MTERSHTSLIVNRVQMVDINNVFWIIDKWVAKPNVQMACACHWLLMNAVTSPTRYSASMRQMQLNTSELCFG